MYIFEHFYYLQHKFLQRVRVARNADRCTS